MEDGMALEASLGVPLAHLKVGVQATLQASRLDDETRARLRSLGLIDGSSLRVCKRGEPFIIQVRATRIGVSRHVAAALFVVPADPAPASGQ
jgi:Fe2+ transport system protein FeoA